MKIRIGFNGSFTGLLYSAGKLNLKTEREKRESRTCWRASASKDVLSRPPRRTSSHDVRNHHLHNARNCRDADELMAQRYRETISCGRLAATRDGHVERGEEDGEFSFFQGETNTCSNRPLPLFWKGHNALPALCTMHTRCICKYHVLLDHCLVYKLFLLALEWIWKRYMLSLFYKFDCC